MNKLYFPPRYILGKLLPALALNIGAGITESSNMDVISRWVEGGTVCTVNQQLQLTSVVGTRTVVITDGKKKKKLCSHQICMKMKVNFVLNFNTP